MVSNHTIFITLGTGVILPAIVLGLPKQENAGTREAKGGRSR